jgi:hypothetical protein
MVDGSLRRALDPVLSTSDVATARRDTGDSVFRHDRLQSAVTRLRERLRQVRAHEEAMNVVRGS